MVFTLEQRLNGWELIDALRSGEFAQGRGRLCMQNGVGQREYCCLGVACELRRRRSPSGYYWSEEPDADDDNSLTFHTSHLFDDAELAFLPPSVRDLYGFNEGTGRFGTDRVNIDGVEHVTLTYANDSQVGFPAIADYLEGVYGPRP